MASVPQGGRPVPYRLNPESIEGLRQATEQYYGRLGPPPSRSALPSSSPQVIDITMDDPLESIDPILKEVRAKDLTDRLYDYIINIARGMTLDRLIAFQKDFENNDLKDGVTEIHDYIDREDVFTDIKGTPQGIPLIEAIKKLVNERFITQLRKDLKHLVSIQKEQHHHHKRLTRNNKEHEQQQHTFHHQNQFYHKIHNQHKNEL
jgi:hypothetical protein